MNDDDFPGAIDFGNEPEESYRWTISYCTVCGNRAARSAATGEDVELVVRRSPRMIQFERECTCSLCGGRIDVKVFDHYPTPEER